MPRARISSLPHRSLRQPRAAFSKAWFAGEERSRYQANVKETLAACFSGFLAAPPAAFPHPSSSGAAPRSTPARETRAPK